MPPWAVGLVSASMTASSSMIEPGHPVGDGDRIGIRCSLADLPPRCATIATDRAVQAIAARVRARAGQGRLDVTSQ